MATSLTLPTAATPIERVLSRFDRERLEMMAEGIIAYLDRIDGDLEDDDPSGQMDEDEINTGNHAVMAHGVSFAGPGCPLSDPDEPLVPLSLNPDRND